MTSVVHGPGSANISWSLAYSGGHPVQEFHVEYRRNDSLTWSRVVLNRDQEFDAGLAVIPPERRLQMVHHLEAEEYYIFRVAASNRLGMGEFTETTETLLSHHIGVPSPPSQPLLVSWSRDSVIISTSLHKFGSERDFSLGSVLILNGTVVSTAMGMDLPENYTLGEELELTLGNVTYRGDWRFAVFASNYLGSSLLSEPSLTGIAIGSIIIIRTLCCH